METHFETFVRAVGAAKDRQGALGEEFVVYPPSEDEEYEATPRNAVTFGAMGVDGVHYAILKVDGRIEDDSPVIQISPTDRDPYSLLAPSFLEYLAIGCGVPAKEMQSLFEAEREGRAALVEFLRDHFDQSRFWSEERERSIDRFRHLLEIRN